MAGSNSAFQRRYPPEMRERAVRMVREAIAESGERVGAVTRVARQLGIGPESLRNWVKQAEIDSGKRPGVTTAEQRRINELERENRELKRANEILKAAASFFARYSDVGITYSCHGYDGLVLAALVNHTLCGVAYRHPVMRMQRGPHGRFSSLYGTTTLRLQPDFPYPPGGPRYERLVFDANDQLIVPLIEWYHLMKGTGAVRTRDTYL